MERNLISKVKCNTLHLDHINIYSLVEIGPSRTCQLKLLLCWEFVLWEEVRWSQVESDSGVMRADGPHPSLRHTESLPNPLGSEHRPKAFPPSWDEGCRTMFGIHQLASTTSLYTYGLGSTDGTRQKSSYLLWHRFISTTHTHTHTLF